MIQLLHGDCLELMKDIPECSVDMIIVDPPYGTTRNKWDSVINLEAMWKQFRRITKKNAAICIFSQQPFTSTIIESNKKMFRYEWIWQKPQGTGFLNANRMPLKSHENICVFYQTLPRYMPQFTAGEAYTITSSRPSENYGKYHSIVTVSDGKRYPTDIIQFAPQHGLHPTQKPVPLLEYLINTYSNEGDTVLDNCMGSGSTGVACVNLNRDFIGIELKQEYFNIATERINDARFNQQTGGDWCLR